MPVPSRAPFPSGRQAVLLVVALVLAEVSAFGLLRGLNGTLGLSDDALEVLAMVLGSGLVLTLAMQLEGLGWRALLHPSGASLRATAGVLLLPVAALVPALVVMITQLVQLVAWIWPMSAWEKDLFDRLMSDDVLTLTMVCLVAPVLEELLFRGVVLRGFLARYPRGQAIAGSAILFGVAHLNIYQFVAAGVLGLVLAWLYERTRSLLPCIVLHALYNAALVAAEPEGGGADLAAWAQSPVAIVASLGLGLVAAGVLWNWLGGPPRRPPGEETS